MALKQDTRRLNVNIKPDLHRAFKVIAAAEGTDMTEILVELIRSYVSEHQRAASEHVRKALSGNQSKTAT